MATPVEIQTLPSFDELVELVENNPAAFEEFKRQKCEEMINSASEVMRGRLWAQQSHIDRVVGRCKNPNHANVVLMEELVSQMCKFQDALDTETVPVPESKDNIVNFDEWR